MKLNPYYNLKIYFPTICKNQPRFIYCSMTERNFHIAVDAIFQNWTALQLAAKQGAAGPQSSAVASWMVDATVQWFFENKNLEFFEVEEFLEDILNQEFNLIVEDGSVTEVSKLVCEYFALCNSKLTEEDVLEKVKQLPKCDLTKCKVALDESDANVESSEVPDRDDNNGDCEMMMDTEDNEKNTTTQTDPEGWTVVSRKKK